MYLQEFAASLAFVSIPGADSRAGKDSGLSPEIPHIPMGYGVRAPTEKALAEPPLGGHPSANFESRGGYELLRHKISRIWYFCFWSEPPADPWFFCPIVLWLWTGRGMIWLAGDVLLYGFLALPDGLLNFLFEGWFLSRGKGGVFLVEFLW